GGKGMAKRSLWLGRAGTRLNGISPSMRLGGLFGALVKLSRFMLNVVGGVKLVNKCDMVVGVHVCVDVRKGRACLMGWWLNVMECELGRGLVTYKGHKPKREGGRVSKSHVCV
ncbi:hypothetical protein PIB30_029187, partial [Stylosanthes scabra]|nr:hypothetical protein [Stylosanthes scabra]